MSLIIHMWPDPLAVEISNAVFRVDTGRLIRREAFESGHVVRA